MEYPDHKEIIENLEKRAEEVLYKLLEIKDRKLSARLWNVLGWSLEQAPPYNKDTILAFLKKFPQKEYFDSTALKILNDRVAESPGNETRKQEYSQVLNEFKEMFYGKV